MYSHANKVESILLAITGLAVAVMLFVYLQSSQGLYRQYEVPVTELTVSVSAAMVDEGQRQARIRGCYWCHGEALEGQQYFAEANRGLIAIAPNLTRKIREYSPAEFARAVRHGVKLDGTSVQPAMPAFAYYNMSDADMAAIIAYISSLPEEEGYEGEFRLMPVGWFRWVAGKFPPNAADLIDHNASRPEAAPDGDPIKHGQYLAESICTECHGDNGRLRVPNTPDYVVAAAYTRDEFHRLMRTGVPRTERKIDYHMVDVSKYRYISFTDAEIDALYAYFRSLAGFPVVGQAETTGS
jgi:cytochrome c553